MSSQNQVRRGFAVDTRGGAPHVLLSEINVNIKGQAQGEARGRRKERKNGFCHQGQALIIATAAETHSSIVRLVLCARALVRAVRPTSEMGL